MFLPTYCSLLDSIGSEIAALRYFAPNGTDHRSCGEQDDAIAAYIRWRDEHPEPKCNVAVDSKIGLPGGWLQLSGGWNDAGSPFDTCRLLVSGCARIDSVCAGYEECRRMDLPTVRMTGRSYTTVPSIRTRGFRGFEVGLPTEFSSADRENVTGGWSRSRSVLAGNRGGRWGRKELSWGFGL